MFALVLAVLLPGAAVAAWFLNAQLLQARTAAEDKVRLLVDNTMATLRLTLDDHQNLMQRLADRPRVRALDAANFDPGVLELASIHPEFNTLTVRDRQAGPVFSSRPNPNTPEQFAAFAWFKEGLASQRFLASDAFKGTLTGRWVTVLTLPVRDIGGAVAGLMSLSLDLLTLNQRVFGAMAPTAIVAVTDRQSRYLLRSGNPEVWLGQP
ncbi:MAG: cache domain-containing protein, partial [Rhizobacter sp.]|nr:cache domain-containing protein [Rhizobacter sp.]